MVNTARFFRNVLFFFTFFSITSFVSCTKKQEVLENVLHVGIKSEIKGYDPILGGDKYASDEISRVYEGLLEYHYLKRPMTLSPDLAETMPDVSEDGLTYTFKIRKGVFFHDSPAFPNGKGRELVAEDFVYSLKRLADPKLNGLGWWLFDRRVVGLNEWREKNKDRSQVDYSEKIEGLYASDRYTLVIKLVKPYPQFLYAFAMSYTFAVPKEAVDFFGNEFVNHPVGTGAFTLAQFNQSKRVVYLKNPNYREKFYPTEAAKEFEEQGFLKDAGKRIPFVDKVVVDVMIEDSTRWLNFQKGSIDYLEVPKDNFTSVVGPNGLSEDLKNRGVRLTIEPSLDLTYTAFNLDLDLFKNEKLRRAMYLSIDSDELNRLFYNSTGVVAEGPIPLKMSLSGVLKGYRNPYRGLDLERAKKLLAEAGYPNGKGLPEITYDCPNGTQNKQIGDYYRRQFEKIGITLLVRQNPWPELNRKILNRDAMLWGIAWLGDYPDAQNFLQLFYGPNRSPGANGSGYNNPEFNRLFEKASVLPEGPERTVLYEKMNKMVSEDLPYLFGVHRRYYALQHPWTKNYIKTDFEAGNEKYIRIDLEEKKKYLK